MNRASIASATIREIGAARRAEADGRFDEARRCLELAHVLGQEAFRLHFRVHLAMLGLALRQGDLPEMRAQVARLALTPVGHLTGRLPRFNAGSGRVSAFAPMDWPPELDRATLERIRRG